MYKNLSKDIIRGAINEAKIVVSEAYREDNTIPKSTKNKIEKICRGVAKDIKSKYGNSKKLIDKGDFSKLSFYYYKDSIDIDFSDISQDEFFNFSGKFWKDIANTMKDKLSSVIKITKTNIGDDCPFIYLFYNSRIINESFGALNEAAKAINGTSKETGYPLTNIKLAGINVAVYVKGNDTPSEEDLKKLDNDYNIIKSKYNKLVFDKKQLLGDLDESEEEAKKLLSMSINEIKKQINLYEVVYFPYDNRFEFCFSVNRGSLLKTYSDAFAINLTINGKDIKVDSDEI